jgi:hypothetical protein
MLLTLAVILVLLWLLGFSLKLGGALIHALLLIAVIVLVFNFVRRQRHA